MEPQQLSTFLQQVEAFFNSARDFKGHLSTRMLLIQQVSLLNLQLQRPIDGILSQWIAMNTIAASQFMVETGVFEKMPLEGGITASKLGEEVGIEASTIARLMRILVGVGIVEETGEDTFKHTPRSREYLPGRSVDLFQLMMKMQPTLLSLSSYFASHSRDDLTDPLKTPFAYANENEGKTFFEIIASDPTQQASYSRAMKQQESFLPSLGMFPFLSLEEQVRAEPDRPFVVDVGGGRGQMLKLIGAETRGGFEARMVLQDQKHVLASITDNELPGIKKMAYDFNTPQPVMNAHVYYFRRVLHSYPDDKCISILGNTASAMGPTSRLLIGEYVVPSRVSIGGELTVYCKDIACLTVGGKERTEKEFAALLDQAGLSLVNVWRAEMGEQAVIEAVLKKD